MGRSAPGTDGGPEVSYGRRGPSPCVMGRWAGGGYARFSAWRRATYAAAWERRSMPSFESRLET